MKLGFVTAILPELSLDEVLGFARAEGYGCVEAMCWPAGRAERRFAGVTHVEVAGMTRARADEIGELCERHGVGLSALGYYPNPLDPDPAAAAHCQAHLREVIAAAPLLGLDTVNTFVGRDWRLSVDDNWPRLLEVWRPMIRFAEDHGVRIGIENCPMFFSGDEWPGGKNLMTTPAIWRRAFADLESANFGLNFDPSHFVLQFMEPASALREFREKLFHVHAKDVRIDQGRLNEVGVFAVPGQWHVPCLPGAGGMDWPAWVGELRAVGYDGPVCLEVEDDSFGRSLEGRQRALRVGREFLAPLVR